MDTSFQAFNYINLVGGNMFLHIRSTDQMSSQLQQQTSSKYNEWIIWK